MNYAFLSSGVYLYTIDVSNPAVPVLVNTFTLPIDSSGSGGEVRIFNNSLYFYQILRA